MESLIKTTFLSFLFMAFLMPSMSAQKIKILNGDFKDLKGQKVINVEFDYSETSVGKFDDEADYIAKKVKEKNEDEAGTGDKWKAAWLDDRDARFQPKFMELFNKQVKDYGLKGKQGATDAELTMVVKTIHTEPGFNVGVMRRPAHINVEIALYKTGEKKPAGEAFIKKVPGGGAMGYDFDAGYRLQEAYAKTGKSFGKYLAKKVIKSQKKKKR